MDLILYSTKKLKGNKIMRPYPLNWSKWNFEDLGIYYYVLQFTTLLIYVLSLNFTGKLISQVIIEIFYLKNIIHTDVSKTELIYSVEPKLPDTAILWFWSHKCQCGNKPQGGRSAWEYYPSQLKLYSFYIF